MAKTRLGKVTIEDAQIRFKNFKGAEGKFNMKGKRNFSVLLDAKLAADMDADGWNVKTLKPLEEGDAPQAYIQVQVKWPDNGGKPPRIVMITSRGRTPLDEEDVAALDYADIVNVDLIFRPFEWDFNDKTGITAYLESMFVTVQEDALELKYADVPDAPDSAMNSREYTQD